MKNTQNKFFFFIEFYNIYYHLFNNKVNNGYHDNIGAKDFFKFGEQNVNGTDADHF